MEDFWRFMDEMAAAADDKETVKEFLTVAALLIGGYLLFVWLAFFYISHF